MSKKITKPKIEINMSQVESLAASGLTNQQIADSLGISESTLYNNQRENEDFAAAIKRGRAKGIAVVTNALMKKVKEGNVTAMIFFLKSQAGWKETQAVDLNLSDEDKPKVYKSLKELYEADEC